MTTFETARSSTKTGAAEAVDMPRRQVIAIAVLMCVPLPLLSIVATLVPLPQIVERAAATFISIAVPLADSEDRLIREKPVAVRSVEITYRPLEQAPVSTVTRQTRRAGSGTAARRAPAREAASTVAVQADASGSRAMQAEAGRGASKPATSPAETTKDPPAKESASKAAKTGRGSAAPRTLTPRGQGGGHGSGEGRPGRRTGGGAMGATPTGSSTHSGTSSPGSDNGQANHSASNSGSGSRSSPVPSPAGGDPPKNGLGKP